MMPQNPYPGPAPMYPPVGSAYMGNIPPPDYSPQHSIMTPMQTMGTPVPSQGQYNVPEAMPVVGADESEMQAKPGIFTNERGNLKVCATHTRQLHSHVCQSAKPVTAITQ